MTDAKCKCLRWECLCQEGSIIEERKSPRQLIKEIEEKIKELKDLEVGGVYKNVTEVGDIIVRQYSIIEFRERV